MAPRNPPPLLDALQQREVCALLALGCSREMASRYLGQPSGSIRATAQRDAEFLAQVRRAEAQHELLHLRNLHQAAQTDRNWRAAAWILERRYPARYGPRSSGMLTADQLAQLVDQFAQIVAEEVPSERARRRVLKRFDELAELIAREAEPPAGAAQRRSSRPAAPPAGGAA